MRHLIILLCLSLFGLDLYAQAPTNTQTNIPAIRSLNATPVKSARFSGGALQAQSAMIPTKDTAFYEDFNGSLGGWSDFTIQGPGGWNWTDQPPTGQFTNEPLINSLTSNNGVLILDADGHNSPGSNYQNIHATVTSPPINTMGYPDLLLTFYHYYRHGSSNQLWVGVSENGTSYTEFDVRHDLPANAVSEDPIIEKINVGHLIGNKTNAKIRFRWPSGTHYFWQIDDVQLVVPPNNELVMESMYFNSTSDPSQKEYYYSQIPLKQANNANLHFGAEVQNIGTAEQPSTKLNATVTGPVSYSKSSVPYTLSPKATDYLDITVPFKPIGGQGNYQVELEVSSDSVDAAPQNNIMSAAFSVTDSVYARDANSIQYVSSRGIGEILANMYEIHTTDYVNGVRVYIGQPAGGSVTGSDIKVYLFDENFNVVTESSTFNIPFSGWQTVSMPQTQVAPGKYYAGVELISGTIWVGVDIGRVPPDNTTWECVGANSGTGGENGIWASTNFNNIPYIRLLTKSTDCPAFAPTATVNPTSNCGANDGSVSISPSNGTMPYTYNWAPEDPNNTIGSGQGTDSISGLSSGVYLLTVTDANVCSETHTFLVSNAGGPILNSSSVSGETCYGNLNGSAEVTVQGGTPPISFAWSTGQNGIGTNSVSGVSGGNYQVSVTDASASNCTLVSNINVPGPTQPLGASIYPTSENCIDCDDGTLNLTVDGGTAPYAVSFSNGPMSIPSDTLASSNHPLFANDLPVGIYGVLIEDANGCTEETSFRIKEFEPVSVSESPARQAQLSAYPNPTSGNFRVELPKNLKQKNVEWNIYNSTGKNIYHTVNDGFSQSFNIENHPAGVYMIEAHSNGERYSRRVLKQ